ncbi:hypothetical protein KGM_206852 [Danaus plexippus plexippus]|uniref:Uncharacterized protein n=1 Tax=Danaus plexippus plexippus TaxID=278856 RepID=A0A212FMZ2_DANPL|nr:hypothetical protein KGM_206852 [Danaus plexippus plexippus]
MVFCYKIITESPRRSRCSSPRKDLTQYYIPNVSSEFISSYDYEEGKNVWDDIPERDWRLLGALARKREEQEEREKLAEQFQKMWLKEKENRQMVEAETSEQYKRYLHKKRSHEKYLQEYKRLQRAEQQQARIGQLIDCIKHKEERSKDVLAWRDDRKITQIIGKAVEEEARAQLAAGRRQQRRFEDEWRKTVELVDTTRRSEDARKRRRARLREESQRLAITNALTSWETSLVRQEVAAAEAGRRALVSAALAVKDEKTWRIQQAKNTRRERGRNIAAITAMMREAVRNGR